jgi:hypothetical protein
MKGFTLIFLFLSITLSAQDFSLKQKSLLEADTFVGVDSYGNYYFINNNILFKQGSDGTLKFGDYQLGKISSVDIINPLKILVFYRDLNTVVFLDNKLNEIERINFNTLYNNMNINTATNAGNNRLWLFNLDTSQLELFNYRTLQKTIVSQPFAGDLYSQASNFNYCFILTDSKLLTFNVYGSLLFEMESLGYEKIVQQNENLVALKENSLFYISGNSVKPIKIPLSENKIKDLHLTQDLLYIYDGINILTYSLTYPKQ